MASLIGLVTDPQSGPPPNPPPPPNGLPSPDRRLGISGAADDNVSPIGEPAPRPPSPRPRSPSDGSGIPGCEPNPGPGSVRAGVCDVPGVSPGLASPGCCG